MKRATVTVGITEAVAPVAVTLRDYFAAAALQGYIASGITDPRSNAEWAYEQADAMLAARDKEA